MLCTLLKQPIKQVANLFKGHLRRISKNDLPACLSLPINWLTSRCIFRKYFHGRTRQLVRYRPFSVGIEHLPYSESRSCHGDQKNIGIARLGGSAHDEDRDATRTRDDEGATMRGTGNFSIQIAFDDSDEDVDAATRDLIGTLRAATYLENASIEPQSSPAPPGMQGALMEAVTVVLGSPLVVPLFNLTKDWIKGHGGRRRRVMKITVDCGNNATKIIETVSSEDELTRLVARLERDCLA